MVQNDLLPDKIDGVPFLFISYSHKNTQALDPVLRILRRNQFRFWYDRGLLSGVEWADELERNISNCSQFLVFITPESVESSFVRKEVSLALSLRKEILVVYLSDTVLSHGLSLLLGDIQAIYRNSFQEPSAFEKALCDALAKETMYGDTQDLISYTRSSSAVGPLTARNQLDETYILHSQIGAGGISKTYLAEHRRTGALVIVKCAATDNPYQAGFFKDCFYREKDTLKKLNRAGCAYIPTLLDFFEDGSSLFLVETLLPGKTLDDGAARSEDEVVLIAKKVLHILHQMHQENILYLDMKPCNLMADRHGNIFLLDFNTSVDLFEAAQHPRSGLGTIGYSAPEQYNNQPTCSYPSDLYSLGRTLEHLLAPGAFLITEKAPIRFYRPDVSAELEDVLERMTADEPYQRYASADEALTALEHYKETDFLKRRAAEKRSSQRCALYKEQKRQQEENCSTLVRELSLEETVILPHVL